ncbi:MAG: four helix bundle protein [Acidimicrobiia bacterium]|nr:four helix bundle protein [Acidimicrobiia bacterium]
MPVVSCYLWNVHDFRRLEVWNRSVSVTAQVYQLSAEFPVDERYGLTSQMRRSAVSIVSNIAEGCGRSTIPDTRRFFAIARGSAAELEAQLAVAETLGFVSQNEAAGLSDSLDHIRAMLIRLSQSFDNTTADWPGV